MNLKQESLKYHAKHKGKIGTLVLSPIKTKRDLTLAYTPGVAEVSKALTDDPRKAYKYSIKGHTVAVVSDGSAVLGLGNIGAIGALPVMEGKCAIFKSFADIDAFPICLNTQDAQEIIKAVKFIAPSFGGINLEDIGAPKCFEIEDSLQDLGIPVMHDDQHGTAVVTLAALLNASNVAGKKMKNLKVVISGAGAAGSAVTKFINELVDDVIVIDSKGIISKKRKNLDPYKRDLLKFSNKKNISGSLRDALINVDVFIGVSAPNLLIADDVKRMNERPIIFALANPVPEIMPSEAKEGGAFIICTGRSDYPNQINNSLAFPGIFKGALEVRATKITKKMKLAAAYALADLVKNSAPEKIIPGPFEKGIVEAISKAVIRSA